mmetsp:Transcript_99657/g.277533  ORF Transcript_99657/g.277533 Transcript_99657/m.277533 type:complete len:269 (+) Transcript_99657:406-1212(+)
MRSHPLNIVQAPEVGDSLLDRVMADGLTRGLRGRHREVDCNCLLCLRFQCLDGLLEGLAFAPNHSSRKPPGAVLGGFWLQGLLETRCLLELETECLLLLLLLLGISHCGHLRQLLLRLLQGLPRLVCRLGGCTRRLGQPIAHRSPLLHECIGYDLLLLLGQGRRVDLREVIDCGLSGVKDLHRAVGAIGRHLQPDGPRSLHQHLFEIGNRFAEGLEATPTKWIHLRELVDAKGTRGAITKHPFAVGHGWQDRDLRDARHRLGAPKPMP